MCQSNHSTWCSSRCIKAWPIVGKVDLTHCSTEGHLLAPWPPQSGFHTSQRDHQARRWACVKSNLASFWNCNSTAQARHRWCPCFTPCNFHTWKLSDKRPVCLVWTLLHGYDGNRTRLLEMVSTPSYRVGDELRLTRLCVSYFSISATLSQLSWRSVCVSKFPF